MPADVLEKRRTVLPVAGGAVAVDVFGGHLVGLVLAEIDSGGGKSIELPDSFHSMGEVTDDEVFTGAAAGALRRRPPAASLDVMYLDIKRVASGKMETIQRLARRRRMASQDSFGAKATLDVDGKSYEIYRLDAVTGEGWTSRACRSA